MIKAAIFTAGKVGRRILEIVKKLEDVRVEYFIDNNANMYGRRIDDIGIISPYRAKKKMDQGEIELVLVPSDRIISFGLREYTDQLDKLGITQYKIIPAWITRKQEVEEGDAARVWEIIENGKYRSINQLQHLQFHVIDSCNLNCRRCQHFSNMAPKNSYADFDTVRKDFFRMRELVDDIGTIAVLGGEPLLNPELPKYLYMIRECFEHSIIEIISNGILARQMSEELIKAIKDNNVLFNISYYPVLKDCIEDIVIFLQQNDIRFFIGKPITEFSKRLTLESQKDDAVQKYISCRDSCCTTLRNGKIYPCYLPATVHIFNDRFGKCIDAGDDGIDIYREDITGEYIVERLKKPFAICGHCGTQEIYPWEQTKTANEGDWLV